MIIHFFQTLMVITEPCYTRKRESKKNVTMLVNKNTEGEGLKKKPKIKVIGKQKVVSLDLYIS